MSGSSSSSDGVYQRVGPEIGVASTKAFSSQACLCAMSWLQGMRDLSPMDGQSIVEALNQPRFCCPSVAARGADSRTCRKVFSR